MKKMPLAILGIVALTLGSCNTPSSPTTSDSSSSSSDVGDDNYHKPTPVLAPDSDLVKYDEIPFYYDNNIVMDDIGGSREVPDPFVYRFNGTYYLYPTTGGGRIKAYKSQDMDYWEPVDNGILNRGYVFDAGTETGSPLSGTAPFAPEVIYYNGLFYLVASPNGNGHYILSSESPEGPFERVTDNLGRSIDGHFFIDSDEQVYFYGASSSAIKVYDMENDLTTFKGTETTLNTLHVGGWNEGPYILQKDGQYYATYCGTHYLSKSYRIDYAYAPEGADLLSSSDYTRMDNTVISTTDTFYGLGHSSTVLAPDLDSYYIVYHNLDSRTNLRYLNYSRLSFNGSRMIANQVNETDNIGIDMPDFYSYGDESYYDEINGNMLSPDATGEDFTVEFNTIGEGRMLFSYNDIANYAYIDFSNNHIAIRKVVNGETKDVHDIALTNEYVTDAYHTFRLQYRQGKMNFYFDSMEKAYDIDCYFRSGKVGYPKEVFAEVGYVAFSNVARGSSDNKFYSDEYSLANGYDEKLSYLTDGSELVATGNARAENRYSYNLKIANNGDRATYRMYAREDGHYNINMRLSDTIAGSKVGIRIDDGAIQEVTIPTDSVKYEGDILVNLGYFELTSGQHNISICNVGDEVIFNELRYEMTATGYEFEAEFKSAVDLDGFITRNATIYNGGIETDNQQACGVLTLDTYQDAEYETKFVYQSVNSGGFAGLIFNVSDYAGKNIAGDGDGENNPYMFKGYLFVIADNKATLIYNDYNFSTTIQSKTVSLSSGSTVTLKVVQKNYVYECYVNDELAFTNGANVGNLSGQVGVFSSNASVYFNSLTAYFNVH